ncbi:hypothetical protein MWU57_16130 [Isoptericola sp. S6320L]|uniref:hypothetical protein n=1 Tax=Isoptericola sp. S6320L TaxID=2926411 RepID=UPI001FF6A896|nr:hypothetical protein [Isoptericola sp. S6320L]MCK0118556.1 hypothetical protein [Isoptericola sp. S6320L]
MGPTTSGPPIVPTDVEARLVELERENAELRRRLQQVPEPAGVGPRTDGPRTTHRWRSSAAVVLVLLATLLAPVGVVAAWAKAELTDTDRYVATVAPLASDPVVQSAVAGRLTAAVMSRIEVGELLDEVVAGLEEAEVAPRAVTALGALEAPLTSGVESFVRSAADRVVTSEAFVSAWEQANRVAHAELVAVMEGEGGELLQVGEDGQLTIQLAGMIELLKERLVERGLGVAANIPTVDVSFTIMQTTQLVEVQNRYAQLVTVGTWLPWVALGLLAAGVLVSTHRMRTLLVAGLALTAAMVALGIALAIARGLYLQALSGEVLRLDAAELVFDQVATFLRATVRTVGVLGLVVALAAYLGGGSASARSLRAGAARSLGRVQTWGESRGWSTGPVGQWVDEHRGFARGVVIGLAALVLLLAADPTAGLVIGTAVAAGVLVTLVELVARAPVSPAPSA